MAVAQLGLSLLAAKAMAQQAKYSYRGTASQMVSGAPLEPVIPTAYQGLSAKPALKPAAKPGGESAVEMEIVRPATPSAGPAPPNTTAPPKTKAPLGLGSTANLEKGTTHPRNLAEQMAIDEAVENPTTNSKILPLQLTDKRWEAKDGWVKMQKIVRPKHGEPITVHYLRNVDTGATDDFKIVITYPKNLPNQ